VAKQRVTKAGGAERAACCGAECCGTGASCCGLPVPGGCQVEAVVSVDARGQMVLPKEVRDRFGWSAGSKIAVVAWSSGGTPCCVSLHTAGEIADRLRTAYGPLLREVVR
jgi:antitoxin PrlF